MDEIDYNEAIAVGDLIEFLSDKQTDKGPCTATVHWILDDTICLCHGNEFTHMNKNHIIFERVTLTPDGRPLYMAR